MVVQERVKKLGALMGVWVIAFGCVAIAGIGEAAEPGHDSGYTIQGPHVATSTRVLGNGLALAHNTQLGAMVTENPESPVYYSRWIYRGSTVLASDGSELGECGVMEITDPEGDMIFVPVVNWYAEGAESHWWIVEGTGKWRGRLISERRVMAVELQHIGILVRVGISLGRLPPRVLPPEREGRDEYVLPDQQGRHRRAARQVRLRRRCVDGGAGRRQVIRTR